MRYIYILIIVFVTAVFFLFAFQNLEAVTVVFYAMNFTLPLSFLILLVYILGMLTGGFAISLLRALVRGATQEPQQD
jgi:uncharacterized integral membrane protein